MMMMSFQCGRATTDDRGAKESKMVRPSLCRLRVESNRNWLWTAASTAFFLIAVVVGGCVETKAGGVMREKTNDAGDVVERYEVVSAADGTDVKHGRYWSNQNGFLEEGEYKNGKKCGRWETISDTGERIVGNFEDDALDGVFTMWDADGKKRLEAHYSQGKLHGSRRRWDANGRLTSEELYSHGIRKR